jgi:hypothetical protein
MLCIHTAEQELESFHVYKYELRLLQSEKRNLKMGFEPPLKPFTGLKQLN